MKFRELRTLLYFSKAHRTGLVVLFLAIFTLQCIYIFVDFTPKEDPLADVYKWNKVQTVVDSLKNEKKNFKSKIYPFNPNFITDYKGYQLGMSIAEIDRLFEFRKTNKYVNSGAEFQQVTKVSDSLLATISPYFKFPDWVTNKKTTTFQKYDNFKTAEKLVVKDINLATAEDLMKVYGIGPALSDRILAERKKFGAFLTMNQIDHIWGLSPEVIENTKKHFKIINPPEISKIKINDASIKELQQFPYFNYTIAKKIVVYRSMNGTIQSVGDLTKIKDFPVEKTEIIALYLAF